MDVSNLTLTIILDKHNSDFKGMYDLRENTNCSKIKYNIQYIDRELYETKSDLTPYIWMIKRLLQKIGIRSKSYFTASFFWY